MSLLVLVQCCRNRTRPSLKKSDSRVEGRGLSTVSCMHRRCLVYAHRWFVLGCVRPVLSKEPDMSGFDSSRREFLRRSAAMAAGAAAAASFPSFARGQDAPKKPAETPAAPAASKVEIEHRKLGKTGLSVAILGFGGAEIGYSNTSPETVSNLLNAALDAGLNVLDTAECYVGSEEQIAKAVGHRRKEYYIFTKCGHWTEGGLKPDWSKPALLKSIERSLKRLNTDVIDLVQLHSCSIDDLKKGECIEALEQAKKEGKTRFIGYSGDSEAAKFAVESGRFDTLQTSLNIVDQEPIDLTLPLAVEEDMGVIVKRTIANAIWRKDKPDGYTAEYFKRMKELDYGFL